MTDCIENENDRKNGKKKKSNKKRQFLYRWCLVQTLNSQNAE